MQKDLKRIKNKYGEKFLHLCRELFPTTLEIEGLLPSLLESNFYPSKCLYYDIVDNGLISSFQNFIYNLVNKNDNTKVDTNKPPHELLDEAGYILYECRTQSDILKFKKYYEKDEELCTFKDERLKTNYVFFAVKKNLSNIKRENFSNPERQDEYGTSVISVQFTKGNFNYVSIKNRYNHTVVNPDSTFGNNLDNIITGLTKSFENTYGFNICNKLEQDLEIPKYIRASDGKFYKYNYEINNIYYCCDNIIIDNFKPKKYEKDRYIIFDYFILDLKTKKISLYDASIKDTFTYYNKNIKKIEIKKENNKKNIFLKKANHQIIMILNSENQLIYYHNDIVLKIGDYFLKHNLFLEYIYLNNVRYINDDFMMNNTNLKEISFPNLEYIGDNFLYYNFSASNVNLPIIREIRHDFMHLGGKIEYAVFPSLIKIGNNFFVRNNKISFFSAPELEEVGADFLRWNRDLIFLELEKLKKFDSGFLNMNMGLQELRLPSLQIISNHYLELNRFLSKIVIPDDIFDEFIHNTSFEYNFKSKSKQKKLIL